jgi:putative phosphoribosyl transferase
MDAQSREPSSSLHVAAEIASAPHAPLDLLLVRKIGAPERSELAVAAVAEGPMPVVVIDDETLRATGASRAYVAREAKEELCEIARRRTMTCMTGRRYRAG